MPGAIETTARRLAILFGRQQGVLFGRARSALTALLDIRGGNDEVIIPSNLCPAVPLAIWAAGARVRLAPIERGTGLPADATLAALVRQSSAPGVVMLAHLYGFVQDYPQTRRAAAEQGWFVLENDSVGTTAPVDGAPPRPPQGDALLISFGYAKTIEAGGGGVLLTDDLALARRLRARAARYPLLDERAAERENWFMTLHRTLRLGPPGGPSLRGLIGAFQGVEAAEVRLGFPDDRVPAVNAALDRLSETIHARRAVAAAWDQALAPLGDALQAVPLDQPVPWRLIRRVPEGRRDRLVAALRGAGFEAGTNYPPLAESYPGPLAGQLDPEAVAWGREVLNLWLTPDYDPPRIAAAAEVLRLTLNRGDGGCR